MAEPRSLLERVMERVELRPFTLDAFYERRDRKRRNQRIAAGIVGIAVFAAAVALVAGLSSFDRSETPAVTGPSPSVEAPAGRVGFIGLPPEGATPSTPGVGELVLSFSGGTSDGTRNHVNVYADGRVIWNRSADLPEGANTNSTGWLEQRLSPEGVELLRSEILSTGLFESDLLLAGEPEPGEPIDPVIGLELSVQNGDRLVYLNWRQVAGLPGFEDWPVATPSQVQALQNLEMLLTPPIVGLPDSAWADPEIKAFVASRYSVCFLGKGDDEPARFLSRLPALAEDMLSAETCSFLTTDEARALSEALDDAGLEQSGQENVYRLEYHFDAPGPTQNTIQIWIEPLLPNGAVV